MHGAAENGQRAVGSHLQQPTSRLETRHHPTPLVHHVNRTSRQKSIRASKPHILSITFSFLSQLQYYTQFPMHWATTLSRTCYLRSFHYKIRLIAFSAYMPFEYGRKNQKETYWIIIFKNNFLLFKIKKGKHV